MATLWPSLHHGVRLNMWMASLAGLVGLAIATALFAWQGFGAVWQLMDTAGWGVVLASVVHVLPMAVNAKGWQVLLPSDRGLAKRGPSLKLIAWAVWLREAVNGLLPVARIGGEVITAKVLIAHGLSARRAVASMVVDVTASLVSQYLFTMLGIGLLLLSNNDGGLLRPVALGLLTALPILAAVAVVQRVGPFTLLNKLIGGLFGERFTALVGSAAGFDLTIRRFYRRRRAVLACILWQLAGWVSGSLEIAVLLWFMGHALPLREAVIIEALIQALSSSAFVVPGAVGVQEGGFIVIGGLVGLTADVALALALGRRARDVMVLLPALIAWQIGWGRRLLKTPYESSP